MKNKNKIVSTLVTTAVMSIVGISATAEDIGFVLAGPDIYYRTGEKFSAN